MTDEDKLITMHNTSNADCSIICYDDQILFYPIHKEIVAALTITAKSLGINEKKGYKREVLYDKRELFSRIERQIGTVGVTYPGFINTIVMSLIKSGKTFAVKDWRVAATYKGTFPKPRLDRMHGFRFSQEQLLTDALVKDSSGLIGAPTRYGKTTLMVNTLRAYPTLSTVVVAPGVDLVKQLYADITDPQRGIHDREVRLICTGSRHKPAKAGGITVCCADSLDKCDYQNTDLLLADEPHALVTTSRLSKMSKFTKARRYGYGATLKGRFDGCDELIRGLFGDVLSERTYLEAVGEGAICPLNIIFVKINLPEGEYRDRDDAYNKCLFKNRSMSALINSICTKVIPEEWQTLIFIKHEIQANMCLRAIGEQHRIAMAKVMNAKQREETAMLMRKNIIKRCLCTNIYVQGVTFSDVKVLINAEGGGNNTSAIQKPGRLAEIRPDKKCGVIIDFMFTSRGCGEEEALVRDSRNRKKAYQEKGYGIYEVETIQELKKTFDKLTH